MIIPKKKKRFEVDYNLLSLTLNSRIRLKVNTTELKPMPTITKLFLSANWYEREVWGYVWNLFFKSSWFT